MRRRLHLCPGHAALAHRWLASEGRPSRPKNDGPAAFGRWGRRQSPTPSSHAVLTGDYIARRQRAQKTWYDRCMPKLIARAGAKAARGFKHLAVILFVE